MFEAIKQLLDALRDVENNDEYFTEEEFVKFYNAAQKEYNSIGEKTSRSSFDKCDTCSETCKVAVDSYSTENEHLNEQIKDLSDHVSNLEKTLDEAGENCLDLLVSNSGLEKKIEEQENTIAALNEFNFGFNTEMQGNRDAISELEHMLKYPELNKLEREYFVDRGMEEKIEKLEKENADLRDKAFHSVHEETHKMLQDSSQQQILYVLDLERKLMDLGKKLEESNNKRIPFVPSWYKELFEDYKNTWHTGNMDVHTSEGIYQLALIGAKFIKEENTVEKAMTNPSIPENASAIIRKAKEDADKPGSSWVCATDRNNLYSLISLAETNHKIFENMNRENERLEDEINSLHEQLAYVDDASIISAPEKSIREEHEKIEPGMEIFQSSWIKVWYAAYDVLPVLSSQRKTISELEQQLKTLGQQNSNLSYEINRIRTCPVPKEVEEVFIRMRSDLVDWEPEIKTIRSAIENFQKAVDSYRNEIPATFNLLRTAKALREDYSDHEGAYWSELDEGISDAEKAFKENRSLDSQIAHERGLEVIELNNKILKMSKQLGLEKTAREQAGNHLSIAAKQIDKESSRANLMHEEIERLLKELKDVRKQLIDAVKQAGIECDARHQAEDNLADSKREIAVFQMESMSNRCARLHIQNCQFCEDLDCGDNMSEYKVRISGLQAQIEDKGKEISELKKNISDSKTFHNALLEKDSRICRDIQKQDKLLEQIQNMIECQRF